MLQLAPLVPSLSATVAIVLLLAGSEGLRSPVARAVQDAPAPIVEAMAPVRGSLSGGETATITGSNLTAVTRVEIAGEPVPVERATYSEITVTVPGSAFYEAGAVEVDVFAGATELPVDLAWTYVASSAVDRQLEYAFRHWDDYNTASYGNFNEWGGDCMNFVSQTLVARGWGPLPDWFNNAQQDWAPAFVHVPSFDEWLSGHPEWGAVRLQRGEFDRAKLGDVVVFDWDGDGSLDHSQVISRIEAEAGADIRVSDIAMVGHNVDTTFRTIEQALEEQGTASARVWIWSIP